MVRQLVKPTTSRKTRRGVEAPVSVTGSVDTLETMIPTG